MQSDLYLRRTDRPRTARMIYRNSEPFEPLLRASVISRVIAGFLLFASPAGAVSGNGAGGAAHSGAVTIQMHDGEISGKFVTVGDVAFISGVGTQSQARMEKLVLGYAPAPGTGRVVFADNVRMRLIQEGVPPQIIFIAGDAGGDQNVQSSIFRQGQDLSPERVASAVTDELSSELSSDLALKVLRVPPLMKMPLGEITFHVNRPARMDGTFLVPVDIFVGDEDFKINVTVAASKTGSVILPVRRLDKGAVVRREDIVIETRNLYDVARDAITDPADAVGRVVTRTLQPGLPIAASAIEKQMLVKRADKVVLLVRISGLEITTSGEALEAGGIGETIRIRNADSKVTVTGRVTGAGEVTVE